MHKLLAALLLLALAPALPDAAAQTSYPDRPIRILVQSPPGGPPDILARLLGPHFTEAWGKAVLIENLPGAAGVVAADRLAKSPPDGYTLGLLGDAPLTTNVTLYGKLPYDVGRDFAPVTIVATTMNLLVVHPSIAATNVQELIALAKTQPGKLNYGSAGSGTSQHLGGEMLKSMAGIDLVHVPYKGPGPAIQAVLGGELTMTLTNILAALPLVRDGRLRALGVSSTRRAPAAPEIPTIAESGLPGFEAVAWFGFVAPAGTPAGIVDKLYQETTRVLAKPDVRGKISGMGAEIVGNAPAAMAAQIQSEIVSKGKVIRATGAKPD